MFQSYRNAAAAVAALALATATGCGPGPQTHLEGPSFQRVMQEKPRVMWVAAHPDDESMGGGMLSQACVRYGASCHFLVFNRGRGGECWRPDGCKPDLGTVRNQELTKAARLYRATLEHYDFFNAPLPVESFPSRQELEKKWMTEGDPAGLVARAIRRFRPDVIITLDAYRGFTGHPEHQAAARFALRGIRLAADPECDNPLVAGEPPHRVRWVYETQNKYWFANLVGDGYDPMPYHEELDADVRCDSDRHGDDRSCRKVQLEHTRVHLSQDGDMATIRGAHRFMGSAYLRRIDPFGEEASELITEILEAEKELGSKARSDSPTEAPATPPAAPAAPLPDPSNPPPATEPPSTEPPSSEPTPEEPSPPQPPPAGPTAIDLPPVDLPPNQPAANETPVPASPDPTEKPSDQGDDR